MRLRLKIENIYDDGEEVVTEPEVDVPAPGDDEDLQDWAEDHLFQHTGTQHEEGDAAYFVKITEADDEALVGLDFEFGL